MLEALNEAITGMAGNPGVYAVVFVLCALDAMIPPLPSESVLVSLAAIAVAGQPNILLIGALGAAGAFVGDNIAYQIGATVGLERFRWQRRPRVRRATTWAQGQLDRRAGVLVVVGRYIPVGRIAVNVTAGATGYSRRRFMVFDAVAAISWAGWSIGLGQLAGHWLEDRPLLGAALAIAVALVIGVVVDRLVRRFVREPRRSPAPRAAPAPVREKVPAID